MFFRVCVCVCVCVCVSLSFLFLSFFLSPFHRNLDRLIAVSFGSATRGSVCSPSSMLFCFSFSFCRDRPTNQPTNQPTDKVRCRVAFTRLKSDKKDRDTQAKCTILCVCMMICACVRGFKNKVFLSESLKQGYAWTNRSTDRPTTQLTSRCPELPERLTDNPTGGQYVL